MERHIELLKGLCRICGKKLIPDIHMSGRKEDRAKANKYSKLEFSEELGELYGMHIELDRDELHPVFICSNDARVLYRYRVKKDQKKHFSTDMSPTTFCEHNDDCKLCFGETKRGRPPGRKRKRGSIGDMHKSFQKKVEEKKSDEKEKTDDQMNPNSQSAATLSCDHGTENKIDTDCVVCITKRFCDLLINQTQAMKSSIFSMILTSIDNSDQQSLVYEIGKNESSLIKKDGQSFALMYRDLEAISKFDISKWLLDRNKIVTSFFCGIGGCDQNISSLQHDKVITLAASVEMAYKINLPKLVCPFAFLQTICLYCISGSRLAVDLTSKTKPSGGYRAIYSWLFEQATNTAKEPIFFNGDVMNVFDNEQVVGRKSNIKPKNKAKVSIITNKGVTQLNSAGNLQKDERLKPAQILKLKDMECVETQATRESFSEIVHSVIDQKSEHYKMYESIHYEQLHHFVNEAIQVVMTEQKSLNGNLSDHIDDNVESAKQEKLTKCDICGMLNSKRKQICIGCKEKDGIKQAKAKEKEQGKNAQDNDVCREKTFLRLQIDVQNDRNIKITSTSDVQQHERYDHIVQNHTSKKEIILTDPVFCNPNSFETVAYVLRQIGLENGIHRYGGESRHWTCICCDGVPYLICTKLKEEAVICTEDGCKKTFLSKQEFSKHVTQAHPSSTDRRYIHEFDWFYVRIGSGHYEMNLMRSFFELNWIPFIEILCEEMGFISEPAKLFAKNCKDLHKTWQLLLTFHFGALRELVLSYVRNCIHNETVPNAKEFFTYAHQGYTSNPNQKYIMDQVCRMSQGIINFRMATRRNNAQLLHSAKYMTKELFHARNHPKYQQIELYDHLQYLLMPSEVREMLDNCVSITTSGNPSSGQDFDFVLEEKNKQLKQWISKGIPTDAMWQKICRNNVLLENIKSNTYSMLGLSHSDAALKDFDIEPAINAYRTVIRQTNYLVKPDPKHVSLGGEELDTELANYLEKASLKRIYFMKSHVLQEHIEDLPVMSNPIPVTPGEREKYESFSNLKKTQMEKEINKLLSKIQDPELSDYHVVYFNQKIKNKSKAGYISFFTELKNLLNMLNTNASGDNTHDLDDSCATVQNMEVIKENTEIAVGNKEQASLNVDLMELDHVQLDEVNSLNLSTLLTDLLQ